MRYHDDRQGSKLFFLLFIIVFIYFAFFNFDISAAINAAVSAQRDFFNELLKK